MWSKLNRRDFVKSAIGAGAALNVLGRAPMVLGDVRGANGHINIGMIGVGGRSFACSHARIVRVAVKPSMIGICRSIRTRS